MQKAMEGVSAFLEGKQVQAMEEAIQNLVAAAWTQFKETSIITDIFQDFEKILENLKETSPLKRLVHLLTMHQYFLRQNEVDPLQEAKPKSYLEYKQQKEVAYKKFQALIQGMKAKEVQLLETLCEEIKVRTSPLSPIEEKALFKAASLLSKVNEVALSLPALKTNQKLRDIIKIEFLRSKVEEKLEQYETFIKNRFNFFLQPQGPKKLELIKATLPKIITALKALDLEEAKKIAENLKNELKTKFRSANQSVKIVDLILEKLNLLFPPQIQMENSSPQMQIFKQ